MACAFKKKKVKVMKDKARLTSNSRLKKTKKDKTTKYYLLF